MMQTAISNRRNASPPHKQRGVVLLIALIMLVAMTLAGIGMMRSVDTGSVIAGNLAFKQATLNASDTGTSGGFNNVMAGIANSANSSDKSILNYDGDITVGCSNVPFASAAGCAGTNPNTGVINLPGYFSSPFSPCEVTGQTAGSITISINGTPTIFNCTTILNAWWADDTQWGNAVTLAPITDPVTGATISTVSYLIHRMCQTPNADPKAAGQLCQTYTQPATGCSKSQKLPCTSTAVFYRITSRSVGVRNTKSYTQTLVLIGI
jgi:Tfp pilus assembly protein PilX